ncbi:MAG: hypothetical protein K6T70_14015 [Meiothermus ruber]|nr:hypothetical protein [Meiothermus ruber]MCL6531209.1 hypothetical protein [Meiothermus ruber]
MNKTLSALGKKQIGWLVALVLLLGGLALIAPAPVPGQTAGDIPKCCAGG